MGNLAGKVFGNEPEALPLPSPLGHTPGAVPPPAAAAPTQPAGPNVIDNAVGDVVACILAKIELRHIGKLSLTSKRWSTRAWEFMSGTVSIAHLLGYQSNQNFQQRLARSRFFLVSAVEFRHLDLTKTIVQLSKSFVNMSTIVLLGCQGMDLKDILPCLPSPTALITLDIRGSALGFDFACLQELPNLRIFSAGMYQFKNQPRAPPIFRSLSKCTQLSDLNLHFWPYDWPDVQHLTSLKKLRKLNAAASRWQLLLPYVAPTLESLQGSSVTQWDTKVGYSGLARFPNLTELNISNIHHYVGQHGAIIDRSVLKRLDRLRVLKIHSCEGMGDDFCEFLAPVVDLEILELTSTMRTRPFPLEKLGHLFNLKKLDISSLVVPVAAFIVFSQAPAAQTLVDLSINFPDGECPLLGISRCTRLVSLFVASGHIRPNDLFWLTSLQRLEAARFAGYGAHVTTNHLTTLVTYLPKPKLSFDGLWPIVPSPPPAPQPSSRLLHAAPHYDLGRF